jgi:hypothetical protein
MVAVVVLVRLCVSVHEFPEISATLEFVNM